MYRKGALAKLLAIVLSMTALAGCSVDASLAFDEAIEPAALTTPSVEVADATSTAIDADTAEAAIAGAVPISGGTDAGATDGATCEEPPEEPVRSSDFRPSTDAELWDAATDILEYYTSKTGHEMRRLSIRFGVAEPSSRSCLGQATDIGTRCLIETFEGSEFSVEYAFQRYILAHEVFHCVQYDYAPTQVSEQWALDGAANWAAGTYMEETFGSGSYRDGSDHWMVWQQVPHKATFTRSYDAIGLFGLADFRGVEVWNKILPIRTMSDEAALTLLFDGALFHDIALAVGQSTTMGSAAPWRVHGPGQTPAVAALPLVLTESSGTVIRPGEGGDSAALGPISGFGRHFKILDTEDVLEVQATGGDRMVINVPGSDDITTHTGRTVSFCLRSDGCACPAGMARAEALEPGAPGVGLVAMGATNRSRAKISITYRSLDEDDCTDVCDDDHGGPLSSEPRRPASAPRGDAKANPVAAIASAAYQADSDGAPGRSDLADEEAVLLCEAGLIGDWSTDSYDQLETILRAFGDGAVEPFCEGPFKASFRADGTFAVNYHAYCELPRVRASTDVSFAGTYLDFGDSFLLDPDGNGTGIATIEIEGAPAQTNDLSSQLFTDGSEVTPYTIDGDTLTYLFGGEPFVFTRDP